VSSPPRRLSLIATISLELVAAFDVGKADREKGDRYGDIEKVVHFTLPAEPVPPLDPRTSSFGSENLAGDLGSGSGLRRAA